MIFVPVIWVSFDFSSLQKKSLNYIPAKKKYLKKVPGPTSQLIWHAVRHVAVVQLWLCGADVAGHVI